MIEQILTFIDDHGKNVVIKRNTPIRTDLGGYKDHWATHLSIRTLIRPLGGSEQMAADKVTLYATHKMYCAVADILEDDKVEDADGNEYRIKNQINPMNFDNHMQIDLELVR